MLYTTSQLSLLSQWLTGCSSLTSTCIILYIYNVMCLYRTGMKLMQAVTFTFMVCFTTRSHACIIVDNPYYIHHFPVGTHMFFLGKMTALGVLCCFALLFV